MSSDRDARRRALDPSASFLVQAPAGSGKTSLLTQRYLRLLALVDEPEEILAITFTRKAAAEMRARILGELRTAHAGTPVEREFERETRELALAALQRDAGRDWQILAAPGRLRIQTIDSFEASLVARLPWFSRLGFSPECTDNALPLYLDAVRSALRSLAEGPSRDSLIRLLTLFDNHFDVLVKDLAALLGRRDELLLPLGWRPLEERGGMPLRDELEANIQRLMEPVLARLAAAVPAHLGPRIAELARVASRNLLAADADDHGFGSIAGWPGFAPEAAPQWRVVAEFLLTGNGDLRKPRGINKNHGFPPEAKAAKQQMGDVLELLEQCDGFAQALQAARELPDPRYTDAQWEVLVSLLRFLSEAYPQLWLQFGLQRETDFKEVSLRTAQALEEAPGVPTLLAERMDRAIGHILVDEFQDTSMLQILLLEKLTASWVPGDGRTLFAVGDPMQSIYEWRNARVDLFLRAWAGALPKLPPLEPLRLTRNFRSRRTLIEAFNAEFPNHFPSADDPDCGAVRYVAAEPDPEEEDAQAARVECHAFLDSGPESEAKWIAEEIARLQAEDPGRERPRKLGVLFRARKGARAVGEALRARGIRYQAIDVDPLAELPAVEDLRSLLAWLLRPEDRLAAFSVLRAPWNGLRLGAMEAIHQSIAGGSVWDGLRAMGSLEDNALDDDARLRLRRTVALYDQAYQWRGRRPIHRLLRGLWVNCGAEVYHGDARSRLAADQFFALLAGYEDAQVLRGLEAFEVELAKLHAPPDPEAPDTLQLLTVHKAKGLEFDVVFLPRLNGGNAHNPAAALSWEDVLLPDSGAEAGNAREIRLAIAPRSAVGEQPSQISKFLRTRKARREEHERTRVLYVAFTRAKEKLHLLASIKLEYAQSLDKLKPVTGSYLQKLWPRFEALFQEAFAARQSLGEPVLPERAYPPLRRLLPEALPALPSRLTETASASAVETEFFRPVGTLETAETAAGTVFHRLMERLNAAPVNELSDDVTEALQPLILAELRTLLPAEPDLEAVALRVADGFRRTLRSTNARPFFDAANRDVRSEASVGYFADGVWRVARLDRIYRDAEGRQHVVDFKLVDAALDESPAATEQEFRAAQRARYGSQMEHYAQLLQMRNAAPEAVTVTLYYPLQDIADSWTVEPMARPA